MTIKFHNSRHNRKGFTIAEMFLVVAIMAVIFAISARTYYRERDRVEFNNSFIKMLEIFKTTRNYATTSHSVYVSNLNVIPADGYGVYINLEPVGSEDAHFTLFANLGSGPSHEEYQNDESPNAFDLNDKVIETYRLPKQVRFQYFIFDEDIKWGGEPEGPTATEAVIIFKPPLADAFVGDNAFQELNEVGMRFLNPEAPEDSPKKCQYININRVKTFPELEYSDCSEFAI